MVTKDGRPYMVFGSPGGDDQCMRNLQTFLNVVEFGMNIQQAIEAPRWSTRSFPRSPFPHTMYPGDLATEDRIPATVRQALIEKGHKVRIQGGLVAGAECGNRRRPEDRRSERRGRPTLRRLRARLVRSGFRARLGGG